MYGTKYICTFDPVGPLSAIPVFTVEFLFKDYSGATNNVKGASVPVLHSWDTDDPKATIKGSSLDITLLNEGSTPLTDFVSIEDDGVKVRLLWNTGLVNYYGIQIRSDGANHILIQSNTFTPLAGIPFTISNHSSLNGTYTPTMVGIASLFPKIYSVTVVDIVPDIAYSTGDVASVGNSQLMFEGFLVQDDCTEILVDFNHEIKLTANDGLGLLKGVTLDHSSVFNATYTGLSIGTGLDSTNPGLGYALVFNNVPPGLYPIVGSQIQIINHASLNGTYTPTSVQGFPTGSATPNSFIIYTAEILTATSFSGGDVLSSNLNLENKLPLLTIINYCLSNTGSQLTSNFYTNIHEIAADPNTLFFATTYVDPQTFLKNDTDYEDCYTVLEKILKRFNSSIFQSMGMWNIVRWDELKFYSNTIHGYAYDSGFNFIGNAALPAFLTCGIDENLLWESAPNHKIFRGFLYNKETFNYKQPVNLLRNFDLQKLGNLLRIYTTGSGVDLQTVKEYEALWWYYDNSFPTAAGVNGPAEYFIRVIYDSQLNEIERYMVVKNNGIHSYPIEVTTGDVIKFSFSAKVDTFYSSIILIIRLTDGTTVLFANEPGSTPTWSSGLGYTLTVSMAVNEWFSVDVTTQSVPFDGVVTVYLSGASSLGNEALYRDIRVEDVFSINQSTKIIGHTHKSNQGGNIKLNEEEEIYIDDTPRNSIAGTLFRSTITGLLQDRTVGWAMPGLLPNKIGSLTTGETLSWRRSPRSIFEGSVHGNTGVVLPQYVSLLNVFKYTLHPTLNLVWGKLEIDYRNNFLNGTLWEKYADVEQDIIYNYEFDYLYANK